MHPVAEYFQTESGLTISYCRYGIAGGTPVFYFHGLPGSRLEAELLHSAARHHGVELVAPDRFGYGETTAVRGDWYRRWASTVAELAAHLHFEDFYLMATSGGGPYALACAGLLPNRVRGTAICCGLGPLSEAPLMKSMPWFARLAARLAIYAPWLFRLSFGLTTALLGRWSPRLLLTLMAWYNGGPDRVVLSRPEVKRNLAKNLRLAFRAGVSGGLHDLVAATRPWPFELGGIRRLQLWHGDRDHVVPMFHSQWLSEEVQHARLTVIEGEGHFSLPIDYAEAVLERLLRGATAGDTV